MLKQNIAGLIASDIIRDWSNVKSVERRLNAIEQLLGKSIRKLYGCSYYDVCSDGRFLNTMYGDGPIGGIKVTCEQLKSVDLDESIFKHPEYAIVENNKTSDAQSC